MCVRESVCTPWTHRFLPSCGRAQRDYPCTACDGPTKHQYIIDITADHRDILTCSSLWMLIAMSHSRFQVGLQLRTVAFVGRFGT